MKMMMAMVMKGIQNVVPAAVVRETPMLVVLAYARTIVAAGDDFVSDKIDLIFWKQAEILEPCTLWIGSSK